MNRFHLTLSMVCILALSACGSSNTASKLDYQSENKNILNLEVPPDLRDPRQNDLYALPEGITARPDAMKQSQIPSARILNPVKDAHIERSGNQRWLVIQNQSAEQIWPLLRAFWQDNGFSIASEEPQAGLMQTEWAENRAKLPHQGLRKLLDKVGISNVYSTSERDKFLIRIESPTKNQLDIFFSHKGLEEVYDSKKKDRTVWQPRANDPNLEAAFLARFMQYIGANAPQAADTTQNASTPAVKTVNHSEFAQLEGDSVLVLGQAQRNVNRIGAALDRIGLTVNNFIAERGVFSVQPAPAESDVVRLAQHKQGWLSKLLGKKQPEPQLEAAPQMFVALEQTTQGQRIHLLDHTGQAYQGHNKKTLLEQLYRQLR